jgi:hypothetical protein
MTMAACHKYIPSPACEAQVCRLWSAHVDALDRHLSARTWALAAVTVVLIVYPVARIVIPAVLNGIVPDVVRNVLNVI